MEKIGYRFISFFGSSFLIAVTVVFSIFSCSSARKITSNERRGLFDDLSRSSEKARIERKSFFLTAQEKKNLKSGRSLSSRDEKDWTEITSKWRWPLKDVSITSHFGPRGRDYHEGVDLKAKSGTPIFSMHSGEVLYVGNKIAGYGLLIVVKDSSGLSSLYAHNSKVFIKKGDRVYTGQKIALSGASGQVSGPHLHFEIRDGIKPLDPVSLLPHSALAGK